MDTAILTPQSAPVTLAGKGFGVRAGAYLIDLLVYYLVFYAIVFVDAFFVGIALALIGREFAVEEGSTRWLEFLVGLALGFVYFVIFEWLYGATPGKRILGLRVVQEDGSPCSLEAALTRGLIRYVDGLFFGIPAYTSMLPPLYQRIGDKPAKTIVVNSKEALSPTGRAGWWFLVAGGIYLALDAIVSLFLIFAMLK